MLCSTRAAASRALAARLARRTIACAAPLLVLHGAARGTSSCALLQRRMFSSAAAPATPLAQTKASAGSGRSTWRTAALASGGLLALLAAAALDDEWGVLGGS